MKQIRNLSGKTPKKLQKSLKVNVLKKYDSKYEIIQNCEFLKFRKNPESGLKTGNVC